MTSSASPRSRHSASTDRSPAESRAASPVASAAALALADEAAPGSRGTSRPAPTSASTMPCRPLTCPTSPSMAGVVWHAAREANGRPA